VNFFIVADRLHCKGGKDNGGLRRIRFAIGWNFLTGASLLITAQLGGMSRRER